MRLFGGGSVKYRFLGGVCVRVRCGRSRGIEAVLVGGGLGVMWVSLRGFGGYSED